MNKQERYIFEKLSEVGRSNVPFTRLAEALAQDPNITVSVPEPPLVPGQVGNATSNTEQRRVTGLIERDSFDRNEFRFRYINRFGDAVHCAIPEDFEPVVTFTKAELRAFRGKLRSITDIAIFTDHVASKGFSIDD